jgi:hypothetical protein
MLTVRETTASVDEFSSQEETVRVGFPGSAVEPHELQSGIQLFRFP